MIMRVYRACDHAMPFKLVRIQQSLSWGDQTKIYKITISQILRRGTEEVMYCILFRNVIILMVRLP
jgi:hypothetical protein